MASKSNNYKYRIVQLFRELRPSEQPQFISEFESQTQIPWRQFYRRTGYHARITKSSKKTIPPVILRLVLEMFQRYLPIAKETDIGHLYENGPLIQLAISESNE